MKLGGCLGQIFVPWRSSSRREKVPSTDRLTCGHCGENNLVVECEHCGKDYVITTAHVEGRMRDAESGPVSHIGAVLIAHTCDACLAKYSGNEVDAAQQQRTCAACHKEFLPQYGR